LSPPITKILWAFHNSSVCATCPADLLHLIAPLLPNEHWVVVVNNTASYFSHPGFESQCRGH
jgi:hypothetical protein